MRTLTAILVAILSVTTSGPLRCPCHLASFFNAPVCESLAKFDREATDCLQSCGCRHNEPDEAPSHDKTPSPQSCPCGPAIDLEPPLVAADRVPNGDECDRCVYEPLLDLIPDRMFAATRWTIAEAITVECSLSQFRYAHSFRC
jgi:hypothetical protein